MLAVSDMQTGTFDEHKHQVRAQMRRLRAGLATEYRSAADAAIRERLCALQAFGEAEVLLSYVSFASEVDTRDIIRQAWAVGKVVALPRCVPGTRQMSWYRVSSFDGLVRNRMGVEEPVADEQSGQPLGTGQRMLALVPGLVFDVAGYRLGYGGGFYDHFLADFDGVSVGLCREAQMLESLRTEGIIAPHDRPVQLVVTEKRVSQILDRAAPHWGIRDLV